MTEATMSVVAGRALPGPEATWPGRQAALEALSDVGWPTRRQERWRYTDLAPLAGAGFELAPTAPGPAELQAARPLLDAPNEPQGLKLVFLDGHLLGEHSTPIIDGLVVEDLVTGWGRFESCYASRITAARHPLATLNLAYLQHGLWLRVADGAVLSMPLHIAFVGSSRAGLAPQPRVVIELGRGAQVTVVQHFLDIGTGAGWINAVTQVHQAADSRLELYRLQEHGEQRTHTSLLAAELDANAELCAGYVDLGGQLVRNDIDIALREPGARADLFGLFIAGPGQHVDDHIIIDHAARETRSDEAFRGVVGQHGHGVFNGKVIVRPNAQSIDARQSSDNLLLGDRAEIDTKPELEIYADDVKCSHGATVGELDAEQLFYLRTRGLSAATARELLTTAFAATVLERVRVPALREWLLGRITPRLHRLAEEPT